jgi:CO dehydrogenase maturation factor
MSCDGCSIAVTGATNPGIEGLLPGVVPAMHMEAGVEHLSRGTGRHVATLLVTLEPYYKALETSRRCAELGRELNIPRVVGVGNKARDAADADAVTRFAAAHGIPLVATIPFDDAVRLSDLAGTSFVDAQPNAAVVEIDWLAGWLLANN